MTGLTHGKLNGKQHNRKLVRVALIIGMELGSSWLCNCVVIML